jgi:hypothetical protein
MMLSPKPVIEVNLFFKRNVEPRKSTGRVGDLGVHDRTHKGGWLSKPLRMDASELNIKKGH